jgi:hypothetical protein
MPEGAVLFTSGPIIQSHNHQMFQVFELTVRVHSMSACALNAWETCWECKGITSIAFLGDVNIGGDVASRYVRHSRASFFGLATSTNWRVSFPKRCRFLKWQEGRRGLFNLTLQLTRLKHTTKYVWMLFWCDPYGPVGQKLGQWQRKNGRA